MTPIIALIGRANVGKSTLFNVLTQRKNALTSSLSGTTRDRQYGYCQLEKDKRVLLIDTAGLDAQLLVIQKKVYQQTYFAIQEANLVLFIVNAKDGCMPQDLDILKKIQKYNKRIILLINKIDGKNDSLKINDFYSLGIKNIHNISAIHKIGINQLIFQYLLPLAKSSCSISLPENNQKSIKVAFIGKPNTGKSTLINSFLKDERMITCNISGTTLDSISTKMHYKNIFYTLTDTAGIKKKRNDMNRVSKISIIKTFQTIETAHVILFIIDASTVLCRQDLSLLDFIVRSGKSIIVIINKWDLLNVEEKNQFKKNVKHKLIFLNFSKIHFISALYKKGIFQIFQSINEVIHASRKKINTSKLIKIMHEALRKHQPPLIQGRRIKLKYAHLGNSDPSKIVIHGNQVQCLSLTYKKYLTNFFNRALKIKGKLVQLKFKNNDNPYLKKKDKK